MIPCEAIPPGRKYRCARMATEEVDEMLLCWQHAKVVKENGPGAIDVWLGDAGDDARRRAIIGWGKGRG